MAVQQLSYGGASSPISSSSPPSVGTSSADTTNSTLTSLTQTGNFLYTFPNLDIGSLLQDPNAKQQLAVLAAEDPFNTRLTLPQDSPVLQGNTGEITSSPGYQNFGSGWYDLLSALQSAPAVLPGGSDISRATGGYSPNSNEQVALQAQLKSEAANPLSIDPGFTDTSTVAPVSQQILGDEIFQQNWGVTPASLSKQFLPQIASAFGVDPSTPEAQQLANMYVTDVLQSGTKKDVQDSLQHHDLFHQIFTALGEAVAYGGWGAAGGALAEGSQLAGEAGAAEAGASAGLSTADQIALFQTVQAGLQAAPAIVSGDPLSIAGALYGASGPASNFFGSTAISAPGTTGTNAPASSGITSSIANTLGLTPDELSTGANLLSLGGKVATPLLDSTATPAESPVSTPITAPVGEPLTNKSVGAKPTDNNMRKTSLQKLLQDMG